MSDYVARVKIQNGRIYRMMVEAGIKNQAELGRLADVTPTVIGNLMNFKVTPLNGRGEWIPPVLRLADLFGCLPDEMFSPEQLTLRVPSNRRDYLISHEEVMRLAGEQEAPLQLEQSVDESQMRDLVEKTLHALTKREQTMIRMRYGMDGRGSKTYDEIAMYFDVTRERVRQILSKALRRLRHPELSGALWSGMGREPKVDNTLRDRIERVQQEIHALQSLADKDARNTRFYRLTGEIPAPKETGLRGYPARIRFLQAELISLEATQRGEKRLDV